MDHNLVDRKPLNNLPCRRPPPNEERLSLLRFQSKKTNYPSICNYLTFMHHIRIIITTTACLLCSTLQKEGPLQQIITQELEYKCRNRTKAPSINISSQNQSNDLCRSPLNAFLRNSQSITLRDNKRVLLKIKHPSPPSSS